jgi:Winged helix DNA-binding domain
MGLAREDGRGSMAPNGNAHHQNAHHLVALDKIKATTTSMLQQSGYARIADPGCANGNGLLAKESSILKLPDSLGRDFEEVKPELGETCVSNSLATRRIQIREIIKARSARTRHFSADLFADPAWDILLDLALATAETRKVSVSSLCFAASVPTTTAHSWIVRLTQMGLLHRVRDRNDKRRCWVSLTPKATDSMLDYLEALPCGG